MKKILILALGLLLLLPLTVSAGGSWTLPTLQKSIAQPPGVQSQLWKDALGELAAGIDGHGMVVAEHILLQQSMSRVVPKDPRKKMCSLLGDKPIPVEEFLMALASWSHNALDEMLKRNPSKWWSPGNSDGPCACEWVIDRECCERAHTCNWQGGFCGCN